MGSSNETIRRCRGQYSIQLQINMIAHEEGGHVTDLNSDSRKWSKLIQDLNWREQVRLRLRAMQPEGWCDYRANECACQSEYLSDNARHQSEWLA